LNERFEQYINGKRENLHSNFTLRLKKILWEARSTPTLGIALIIHRGSLCKGLCEGSLGGVPGRGPWEGSLGGGPGRGPLGMSLRSTRINHFSLCLLSAGSFSS
jgi:hypothetical protein